MLKCRPHAIRRVTVSEGVDHRGHRLPRSRVVEQRQGDVADPVDVTADQDQRPASTPSGRSDSSRATSRCSHTRRFLPHPLSR